MKARVLSVDVFRGMTIAAMILVNNPGTWAYIYPPLAHAEWHGLTPTDLIFPFFLFIVGITIVLAYGNTRLTGSQLYKKIAVRSLKLIFLGLFLGFFLAHYPFIKPLGEWRFPGVLQRIGVVFFIVSMLYFNFSARALAVWFVAILVGYWLVMTQIPIDGVIPPLTMEESLASQIDSYIFTSSHMWKEMYDPEGLLSTIPAIATSISGILAGFVLKNPSIEPVKKIAYFTIAGLVLLMIGYTWDMIFPINKALWTSSFVLVTTGYGLLVFSLVYYIIDVKGFKTWSFPFMTFGMNAIAVYFLNGFIAKCFYQIKLSNGNSIHQSLYGLLSDIIEIPKLSSLIYALLVVSFYYLIALFLYKKKIFFKV
jgi:predicted acyltransferase